MKRNFPVVGSKICFVLYFDTKYENISKNFDIILFPIFIIWTVQASVQRFTHLRDHVPWQLLLQGKE